MEQQMNYNQDHKISSWWYIALLVVVFVLGVITGSTKACAQSRAIARGYFGGQYTEARVAADYVLSEDNRSLDFVINGDTIPFNIMTEKMTILNDSVVRTEYILDKNSTIIIEPAYESGIYIGDYCKMIMREIDPFDKVVILFWSDPGWSSTNEDVARYQWPAGS